MEIPFVALAATEVADNGLLVILIVLHIRYLFLVLDLVTNLAGVPLSTARWGE